LAVAAAQSIAIRLWQRFLFLGWIGRVVTVVVVLYAIGWAFGNFGFDGIARQLSEAAILILSVLLTALFIRLLWRDLPTRRRR
jgi:membrane protein DedA with SNARE-associated domain